MVAPGEGIRMFLMRSNGRLFLRSFFGYSTYERAMDVSKSLWHQEYAVQVKKGWWRWHVWRSAR